MYNVALLGPLCSLVVWFQLAFHNQKNAVVPPKYLSGSRIFLLNNKTLNSLGFYSEGSVMGTTELSFSSVKKPIYKRGHVNVFKSHLFIY